jgi:hypothetical protein
MVVLLPWLTPALLYLVLPTQPCAAPQVGPGTKVSLLPVSKSKVKTCFAAPTVPLP